MPELRILVTGSRHWTDRYAIRRALLRAVALCADPPSRVVVVHGGARGADAGAGQVARGYGWTVEPHPADWDKYGRSAGHRRNAEMVALGADVCLAFPLGDSQGTRGCMKLCERAGIPVRDLGDPEPDEVAHVG